MVNNTSSDQRITTLMPIVYDENGDPITSAEYDPAPGYDELRTAVSLAPEQSLPFGFLMYLPDGVSFEGDYKVLVEATPAERARDDLEISEHEFDLQDWPEYFSVTGTYENPGPDLTEYTAVVVTVYDESERVIGVGWSYATRTSLLTTGEHEFRVDVEMWDIVGSLELAWHDPKLQVFGY